MNPEIQQYLQSFQQGNQNFTRNRKRIIFSSEFIKNEMDKLNEFRCLFRDIINLFS